jgi:bifunctional pyridoxal-dependent enzyme with beta-cystathionase and maltose regulon repressor activities
LFPILRITPKVTGLTQTKYALDIDQAKKDIQSHGLAVILASNPRNPTGQVSKIAILYVISMQINLGAFRL